MEYQRIKYLEWIRENLLTVENDLARAAVDPISLDDLDLTPEDISISGRNFYGLPRLVEKLSSIYDLPEEQIVITHGASMGIYLTLSAILNEGEEVLLEVPNYEPLYRIPQAIGSRVKILERSFENNYQLNLQQLERKLSKQTKAIILTNLHNPSGVATNQEKIETICKIAEDHNARLIMGEAYLETVFEKPIDPAHTISQNAVSIGSLSKAYGLEGLRVGWIFCDPSLAQEIQSVKNYISPQDSYPSQVIAAQALEQREKLLERGKNLVLENYNILKDWINNHENVEWVPPDGGPICFFKVPREIDIWNLVNRLKSEYNTLVVPGNFFWAKGFIRIGFGGSSEQVKTGIENLEKALEDLGTRPSFYS